jgi:dihydrodipicolinate synthase/N-acetylneuraminate lyase
MVQKRHPQGVLGPCEAPWTESYELDEEVFRRHIQLQLELGIDNIYVMGTSGEGYAVTDNQFRQIVDVFVDSTKHSEATAMISIISLSMGHIIERIKFAHDQGIRMFQITLPSWGTLTNPEVQTFFKTVCGSFPDSKFLHYNLGRTGRILGASDYRSILEEVPNLVATKINHPDMWFMRDLIVNTPELQHFVLETCYANASFYGECSLLCSFGGIAPKLSRSLFESGRNGDSTTAFAIQARMSQMHEGFFRSLGGLEDRLKGSEGPHMDGAFDKLFANLAQPEFPIRILPPYQSLNETQADQAREYFHKHCTDIS